MFVFDGGETPVHRLDARAKLVFQIGFVTTAYLRTDPFSLLVLTIIVAGILHSCRVSIPRAIYGIRHVLAFLALAPLIGGMQLVPPWFAPTGVIDPGLAAYRIVLILLVGMIYVRTTPIRESQAAIAWFIPGRVGRFLGLGVGLVAGMLPQLRRDISRMRTAMRMRHAGERPVRERMTLLSIGILLRGFDRADKRADALRSRCLSWNPTLPPLTWQHRDTATVGCALVLTLWGIA